jgi:hypothetical protein
LGLVACPAAEVLEVVEAPEEVEVPVVGRAALASRGALVPAGEAISGKAVAAAAQAREVDRAAVRVGGVELAPELGQEVDLEAVLDLVLEVDRAAVQVAAPEGAVELVDRVKEGWLFPPETEQPLREDGTLPRPCCEALVQ